MQLVPWDLIFTLIAGLVLFLYGIENFSREMLAVAKGNFSSILGKLTTNPVKGAFMGAGVTALVQSSTATTVITIGLVNAGIISFIQSLGIIIGSNVGTTVTAQLVAFELTAFGPIFILIGFMLGLVGKQYRFLGKPIFYFGLVFFSLGLLTTALEPFQNDPELIALLSQVTTFPLAILIGLGFTVLVQSSAITTGIVVVLALNGLIGLEQAILLLLGANIGTTTTSLIASWQMGLYARRSAVAHFIFNAGGVLLILPLFGPFVEMIELIGGSVAQQVANAHLLFNVSMAIVFLLFITQFARLVERVIPGEEKEILIATRYLGDRLPDDPMYAFSLIEQELKYSFEITRELFQESTALLKDGNTREHQKVVKFKTLNEFLDERIERAIYEISKRSLTKMGARRMVLLVRMSNIIYRMGDWGKDFADTFSHISQRGGQLPEDLRGRVFEAYDILNTNMDILSRAFPGVLPDTREQIKLNDERMREIMNVDYEAQLERLSQEPASASDSVFVELLSIIEAANGNVHVLRKLSEMYEEKEYSQDTGGLVITPENDEDVVPGTSPAD